LGFPAVVATAVAATGAL